MRACLSPSMVLGSPPTPRDIPRAGPRAWVRRYNCSVSRRLVGGVFLLAALFATSAHAADGTLRLEWARAADVAYYLVEQERECRWAEIARVRNADDEPRLDPARGVFTFEAPASSGRFRLTAVDAAGNMGPPAYLARPAPPPSCTWEVAGHQVPVRCERPCTCEMVTKRLDEAREDLRSIGVLERPELLDQALQLTTIEIVGPERLRMPGGQLAAGAAAEGSVLLATDMRAAAHEFFHLYQFARGDRSDIAHCHDAWEHDSRLRDLDAKRKVGGQR